MSRATPLAEPVDIDAVRNLDVVGATGRLGPGYGPALGRLPTGLQVFRGLPFALGPISGARFILVDEALTIPLPQIGAVSHLVVAHLCDAWRDAGGKRPVGMPIGHVVPVGEPLARYEVVWSDDASVSRTVRRRFEINDGVLGWGSGAFAAVPHLDHEVLDWRGPHQAQTPGRYAPAGQSGSLTIMPGTYGGNQVGMTDFVPSAADDGLLWLHSIPLDPVDREDGPTALRVEPRAGGRPGSDVVIAAVTLFRGTANPLSRSPRFAVKIPSVGSPLEVDLGSIFRSTPVPGSHADDGDTDDSSRPRIFGWGGRRHGSPSPATIDAIDGRTPRPRDGGHEQRIVDLSVAADATLTVGSWTIHGRDLLAGAGMIRSDDGQAIEVLPAPSIPVGVEVVDAATGRPVPARVRFTAIDGRYLPPDGHRDEVNPGFFEDTGADLILAGEAAAYVPGQFTIGLPAGSVQAEVLAGFERTPVRLAMDVTPETRHVRIELDRAFDLRDRGWVTADSHVHFLSPATALLQAAAEDIDVVNLLAAGWGDLYTNVTDLPLGSMAGPNGSRQVVVGTENRQNMLGHLALLGARHPIMPLTSGGPPEGRLGGAVSVLLADWADRCREAGGLVIAAHFPLPYAEIAADIVAGKIDAIEAQAFAPGLDDPTMVEWYRYLNLGYRLPIVAGTDKMSAEVPVGAVRTYTNIADADRFGEGGRGHGSEASAARAPFDLWATAVRAGRTFVTSGPLIELAVEGREPGGVIQLGGPGRVEAAVRVRAVQPVISAVELVVNGRVVAAETSSEGVGELSIRETIAIERGSWIAARSRSPYAIESAFTTSMAAHTSPVYVEVADRPLVPSAADAAVVQQVIDGARTWVAGLATVANPSERARMVAFLDDSLELLRSRLA